MSEGAAPLLCADHLRIEAGGATLVEGLSVESAGERVLLVGGDALIAAILGVPLGPRLEHPAQIVSGRLLLLGRDVARGAHRSRSGRAMLDPAFDPSWTVSEWLRWHARLGGTDARHANVVLERFGFGAWSRSKLRALGVAERRALNIAAAVLGDPPLVVIERPLDGLDEDVLPWMLAVIAKACEGRGAIVSAERIALGSAAAVLAEAASDVIVLRDGALLRHVPGSALWSVQRYLITVVGPSDALAAALADRGIAVEPADGGRWMLRLPEGMGPSDVMAAASNARASVVACMPELD